MFPDSGTGPSHTKTSQRSRVPAPFWITQILPHLLKRSVWHWIFHTLHPAPCRHVHALISELRLTVPEFMYLFFFSFFLAFITWYEGGAENIMTMLTCSTILCTAPWARIIEISFCAYSTSVWVMEHRE